jgi:hypothetical protein
MSWKVRSPSPCSSAPTGPNGIRIEYAVYFGTPKLTWPLEIRPEQIWCLIRHNRGRVNFVLWEFNHNAADVRNDCQVGCRFQMSRIRKGEFLYVHCDNNIKVFHWRRVPSIRSKILMHRNAMRLSAAIRWPREIRWPGTVLRK